MATGAVVGNIQGSEGYAYGSAVVDAERNTAWVFGSHMDLCGDRRQVDDDIRAWWSTDLATWHTTAQPAINATPVCVCERACVRV